MTPQAFSERLEATLGSELVSVVLYGSAAAGVRSEKYSVYNVLVVCQDLSFDILDRISPLTQEWAALGNPPPLLFTLERLKKSSDVFPIELLDIKETHEMLFGEDVLRVLPINQSHLRSQLEHELKGKLIQLRESYLLAEGRNGEVSQLMLQSLSTFQVLLRAALRFYEVNVPKKKSEAARSLGRHVNFDLSIFEDLQELKVSERILDVRETRDLFQRYLLAIEQVADIVDRLGRS